MISAVVIITCDGCSCDLIDSDTTTVRMWKQASQRGWVVRYVRDNDEEHFCPDCAKQQEVETE